ncbi:hypothetical protein EC988_001206 [Linderina pennispora]|nr:hypothetical protein EC988_001206 [Linderina pennispora]
MSSFHNDIFNRRTGGGHFSGFSQTPFAPAHMPKPLFSENRRRSSFQSSSASLAQSQTFSYEAACEICEEMVRCGRELCVHEHRIVCRGVHHGCCCHSCCMSRESLTSTCHEETSHRACREESSCTQVKQIPSHHIHHSEPPLGVTRVFAKNFFLPRDTYDHNRAQVFVKPNGKLKIVVPVLGS